MKPLLLLLACVVGSNAVKAQFDGPQFVDNTIVLIVSDTLPTATRNIIYEAYPLEDAWYTVKQTEDMDYEKLAEEQNARFWAARDKLEKELKAKHYALENAPTSKDLYAVFGSKRRDMKNSALRIELNSDNELKELVDWLAKRGGVNGSVMEWTKAPTATAQKELTTRLFHQAHSKAEQLAVMGGRKLGNLVAAEDFNNGSAYGFSNDDFYGGDKGPVIRSMRFKFDIVD